MVPSATRSRMSALNSTPQLCRRTSTPRRRLRPLSRPLSAGALAMLAPWPAAGPTLAFLQLLLRPADPAFSGHFLLGILDPADELVAGQRRDVLPGIECHGVGDQRLAQVSGKFVHHPTGHSRAAHRATVIKRLNPPATSHEPGSLGWRLSAKVSTVSQPARGSDARISCISDAVLALHSPRDRPSSGSIHSRSKRPCPASC